MQLRNNIYILLDRIQFGSRKNRCLYTRTNCNGDIHILIIATQANCIITALTTLFYILYAILTKTCTIDITTNKCWL